ncbi:MAG: 2,3-bisphosphoglycerate-dependent phosphoglycerate mutase [Chloroherpetonaceae bacterium]|nr:2,3-bisphosphoglycerate-dependent phosphoglycerate mutase [Chloroherpetonaceae bacterium]
MSKLILIRHGQSQWNLENRFTGWVDVPITEKGRAEARSAGEKIKDIPLDLAYTSVLYRAIETLIRALEGANQLNVPTYFHPALNERHYGALQGLNKAETAKIYGDEQVKIWRRSYDVPPPSDKTDLNPEGFTESLKDTAARAIPYFNDEILPKVKAGKNVVVSAHGNSLRAIVMSLDGLSKEEVLELNIPNGVPIVYEYDGDKLTSKSILN